MNTELNKILRQALRIKCFRTLKKLDGELFSRCKQIKRYIEKNKIPSKVAMNLPPVIVGAVLNRNFKVNVTQMPRKPFVRRLEKKLQTLGTIGLDNGINIVGNCAEVHCANDLLAFNNSRIENIIFTKPYRPRTSEVIPPCANCIKTFN